MVFLVILMSVVNSEYVAFFFGSNKGRLIFSAIVAWPAIGIVAMKRILTLEF